MDYSDARAALQALQLSQVELAAELAELTGKKYASTTVNKWFTEKGRGPSDVCVVYLKMRLAARESGHVLSSVSNAELVAELGRRLAD